jgi:hypothetical protein
MRESFLDTAEQILRFKSHRDGLVRKMVITLIPTLAAYETQVFSEHHLHKSMGHLLTQLEKPNERSFGSHSLIGQILHIDLFLLAFIAIGHTATAVGSDMKPFLDSIMAQIKFGLQARGYVSYTLLYAAIRILSTERRMLLLKNLSSNASECLLRLSVQTSQSFFTINLIYSLHVA